MHVVLDRGDHPLAAHADTGGGPVPWPISSTLAGHWVKQLRDANLHPARTKIEAAPWCTGLPQQDRDAADEPADRYFEHHVKILLPSATVADLLTITDLVEPHGARLSRNARRRRPDGRQERFVNQRCHGVGLSTAKHRLDEMVTDLRAAGYEVPRSSRSTSCSTADWGTIRVG